MAATLCTIPRKRGANGQFVPEFGIHSIVRERNGEAASLPVVALETREDAGPPNSESSSPVGEQVERSEGDAVVGPVRDHCVARTLRRGRSSGTVSHQVDDADYATLSGEARKLASQFGDPRWSRKK